MANILSHSVRLQLDEATQHRIAHLQGVVRVAGALDVDSMGEAALTGAVGQEIERANAVIADILDRLEAEIWQSIRMKAAGGALAGDSHDG